MKIRLAYSRDLMLTFTLRGKSADHYQNGFVRLNGKTVSGYAYQGLSTQWTFFPLGKNEDMARTIAMENRFNERLVA